MRSPRYSSNVRCICQLEMWGIFRRPVVSIPVEFSSGTVTHHTYPYCSCSSNMGKAVDRKDSLCPVWQCRSSDNHQFSRCRGDSPDEMSIHGFVVTKLNFVVVLSHIRAVSDLVTALSMDRANFPPITPRLSHIPLDFPRIARPGSDIKTRLDLQQLNRAVFGALFLECTSPLHKKDLPFSKGTLSCTSESLPPLPLSEHHLC